MKECRSEPTKDMKIGFDLFDDDETNSINFKNLKRVAKELGENMTDDEISDFINEARGDGHGENITFDEFCEVMQKTGLYYTPYND